MSEFEPFEEVEITDLKTNRPTEAFNPRRRIIVQAGLSLTASALAIYLGYQHFSEAWHLINQQNHIPEITSVPQITLTMTQAQNPKILKQVALSGATISLTPDPGLEEITLSGLTDQPFDIQDVTSKNKSHLSAKQARIRETDGKEVKETLIFVPESVAPRYSPDLSLSLLRFEVCKIQNDRRQQPNLMLATILPPFMMKP